MKDLSCAIRMWTQVSFDLSQCTRLVDRQTDRQTDISLMAIPYVALHAVSREQLHVSTFKKLSCFFLILDTSK